MGNLLSFDFAGPKPIEASATRRKGGVDVQLVLQKGYGIQRKAGHKIQLVKLALGHEAEKDLLQKIRQYGKPIAEVSQLDGIVAREDKEYFSQIKPIAIAAQTSGELAVTGKIYYCSFSNKFCSVQSIAALVQ